MSRSYNATAFISTVLGTTALAYQATLLWTGSDAPTVEKLAFPLASVGAALLPVLAEAYWKVSRRKALALALPGVALFLWVLPATASKMANGAEQAILTATAHNERLKASQDTLQGARTAFLVAQRDQAAECRSGAGTRCKGANTTLANARADLAQAEANAGGSPMPVPSLPALHAGLLPVGLELTIWACLMVGLGPLLCIERDLRREPLTPEELDELRELHQPEDADEGEPPRLIPAPQRRPVTTRLAAERDLVWLLASGQTIPSQEWLRKRWGVENKGTVCKWLEIMEDRGLCTRKQIGRQKMIVRAEPSLAA
jgi:hypothetical protein